MRSLKKGTYADSWMRGMMAISFGTSDVAEGAALIHLNIESPAANAAKKFHRRPRRSKEAA